MSPPIFRKNDQPTLPQSSAHQSSSTSKRQSIMIAGCAILSVGATTMVTGCQSNPTVSSSAAVSGKMIDFETVTYIGTCLIYDDSLCNYEYSYRTKLFN